MNELDFLKEYKKLCLKYKMQILGWDSGAYLSDLEDEELKINKLSWLNDGYEDISFADDTKIKMSEYDKEISLI